MTQKKKKTYVEKKGKRKGGGREGREGIDGVIEVMER